MKQVRLLRSARFDAGRAAGFYREVSTQLAAEFLAEVNRAAMLLGFEPELGAPTARGARRFVLRRFPYTLIYRVDGERVVILAVAHQRQHPDFWLDRA